MHTNLDNARGGVNFKIAERLQAASVVPMGDEQHPGQWVIAQLQEPMMACDFIHYVKKRLEAHTAMCNELLLRPIRRVAICGGAGDFLLDSAVAKGADAFLTGEMHYHQYFGYEQQIQICVVGHYESEHFTKQLLRDIIAEACPEVRTVLAETTTNPIIYI